MSLDNRSSDDKPSSVSLTPENDPSYDDFDVLTMEIVSEEENTSLISPLKKSDSDLETSRNGDADVKDSESLKKKDVDSKVKKRLVFPKEEVKDEFLPELSRSNVTLDEVTDERGDPSKGSSATRLSTVNIETEIAPRRRSSRQMQRWFTHSSNVIVRLSEVSLAPRSSKQARLSYVKAEPAGVPTRNESKNGNESTVRRSLRSRKSVPSWFSLCRKPERKSVTRGRNTCSPRTRTKSKILSPADDHAVLKLNLKRNGSTDSWSPQPLTKDRNVTSCARKLVKSCTVESDQDTNKAASRRSTRRKSSVVPFQIGELTPPRNFERSRIHSVPNVTERKCPKTPVTPRTPRMSVVRLTPSLPERSGTVCTPNTPRDRAMTALHISSVPESLPCRQSEFSTIYNFLLKKIKGVDGGFLYIYGIPGAGKTATVDRVIKQLKSKSSFTFVDINGMHLKQPKDAYRQIWRKLGKDSASAGPVSAKKAKQLLEEKFSSISKKRPTLLLIDEFDMLFNRTLSVVDAILDWIDQSKLIVVAIANSKDLIEEIDKSSSKSRMLRERLCDVQFKTYSYKQLQEIIEDRLKHDDVFTKEAIELLARKSALSGDVRLALNLCRRVLTEAGDIVAKGAIGVKQVYDLLEQIHKDPKIEFMKSLSMQEQLLLRAIRDAILTSGLSMCSLEKNVYDQYKTLCLIEGAIVRDEFSLFRVLRLLEMYGIVQLVDTDCTIHTEISLGNNLDYIQMAFPPRKQ